jgi:hypothetical protein
VKGGTTTIQAGAFTTINLNGGKLAYNSTGTAATINVRNDGDLSFEGDPRGKTITNPINVYGASAMVRDGAKSVNSGVLSLVLVGTPVGNITHGLSNTVSLT